MRSLKMPSDKLPPGVPLVVLAVSTCLMTTNASPVCQTGTKRYYNQAIDLEVCCRNIQCDRGEQPMPCNGTSPIPTCLPCSEHTYQPVGRRLSDGRPFRNCRVKTNCDFYLDKGTTATNAKCGCPPDRFDSGDGICFHRPECPPGEGQTMMGSCERCIEGKTFSDKSSFTENCMPVTNCKARSKCIHKKATIYSDNECGRRTNNLQPCKNTVLTTRISIQHEVTQPSTQSSSGNNLNNVYYIFMICVACVPVAVIMGIIRFFLVFGVQKKKYPQKKFSDILWLTLKHMFFSGSNSSTPYSELNKSTKEESFPDKISKLEAVPPRMIKKRSVSG